MLQRLARVDIEPAAPDGLLDYYCAGWAVADPARILEAAAPNYHFYDPLVGRFSPQSLPQYFELLRLRLARAGMINRCDLAFFLRGPMTGAAGRPRFWREAPRIGLTGIAEIVLGPYGVVAERVAYDLNLASDLLCRAFD